MALELKLRRISDSVGVVLPEGALADLKANEGDSVLLIDNFKGFHLTANAPEFAKTMPVFADLSRRA